MKRFDARAWIVWLGVGTLLAILARNPLYLLILLAVSRIVESVCASTDNTGFRLPFWRISAAILFFSTVFNMLTAHFGTTVLVWLPESWWIIGGPLTAEAAVYGLISGLSLVTILSFFLAFNAVMPISQLTRLTPRAFHELGLVLLVAVTYVPEVARQWQRIREAQAIRGHRVRILSDWRPLALPLLVGGLERSMNLAETMVSRGHASAESRSTLSRTKVALLAGLGLALTGVLALAWEQWAGWPLILCGAAVIGLALWAAGKAVVVTRYRAAPWSWRDTAVLVMSVVPLGLLVLWPGARESLGYSPYPNLALPPFAPAVGLALLALLAPAALEMAG